MPTWPRWDGERVYAISAARRLVHPAVLAILRNAKEEVFPEEGGGG